MYLLIICTFVYLTGGAFSSSLISPCKVSDTACIENTVNAALPQIFDGIPELGIEKSDSLFLEVINASQPILNFLFHNSSIFGLKNCKIANLQFNVDVTSLHTDVHCTNLSMSGDYELDGTLITLPINGKGTYRFSIDGYHLKFDIRIKKVEGADGKNHLFIRNYKLTAIPIPNAVYDFKNLFDGKEDLAKTVHDYAKDNWKEVAEFIQDSIWGAILNKVFKNVNKYLGNFAVEDLLLS